MKKVYIKTLGCKVNQYDGQCILERLKQDNYSVVPDTREADVCIINTCTVTSRSDKKSRTLIRKCIKENPDALMLVTGCGASSAPEDFRSIAGVDCVIKNDEKEVFSSYLTGSNKGHFSLQKVTFFYGHDRIFVKIQDGCNYYCSYCIVPSVRGKPVSKPYEDVIDEVDKLVNNGYREVVLTGINLGLYGKDFGEECALVKLVQELLRIPHLQRIRLSSIEVNLISPEIIRLMAAEKRLCNHFHIPLQSGSDSILKKMKRRYTRDFFVKKINEIRKNVQDVTITTDLMVGFPGESEQDHHMSMDLVEIIGFSKVHLFPFSFRRGVHAEKFMDEQVFPAVIRRRVKELEKVSFKVSNNLKRSFLGRVNKVFIESKRDKTTGNLQGLTSNYLHVLVSGDDALMGKIEPVEITGIDKGNLTGHVT